MDVKKLIQQISVLFFITWLMIILSILTNYSTKFKFENEMKPIDFEVKTSLDECYLTVHNFVTINQTLENGTETTNKKDLKTYIYSYTKPYLLELVQNSTENCVCCG